MVSFPQVPHQNLVHTSHFLHTCHMPCPSPRHWTRYFCLNKQRYTAWDGLVEGCWTSHVRNKWCETTIDWQEKSVLISSKFGVTNKQISFIVPDFSDDCVWHMNSQTFKNAWKSCTCLGGGKISFRQLAILVGATHRYSLAYKGLWLVLLVLSALQDPISWGGGKLQMNL